MRKVQYPDDIEALKEAYKSIFADDLSYLEKVWEDYRRRVKELKDFNIRVDDLLVMDYEGLVKWYRKYTHAQFSDVEKKMLKGDKTSGLYHDCFNYDKYRERIKAFFLDPKNGFELHVCHYCEMAYINSFKIDENEQLMAFLNGASLKELFENLDKRNKAFLRRIIRIKCCRPFRNVKELAIINKRWFKKTFTDELSTKKVATFDIDHVLDKGSCPLVALSLFNFVPSCQVCNSRIKHTGVLGRRDEPEVKLSPTYSGYDFDKAVKIRLHSKYGNVYIDPVAHKDEYELDFQTYDEAYRYEVDFFKLKERYNYHIVEALRILELKKKYNKAALELISGVLPNDGRYVPANIEEDLLGIDFHKKHNRCFEKMYRDIYSDNDPRL